MFDWRSKIQGILAIVGALVVVAYLLITAGMVLDILAMLSPVITILLVAIFTKVACRRRETAIMSLGGIFLYAMSWPMTGIYGQIPGGLVFLFGFCAWIWAIPISFDPRPALAV